MFEYLIYVFLGIGAVLGAEAIYFLIRYSGEKQRASLRKRLRRLGEPGEASLLRERRIARTPGLDRLLRSLPFTEQLENLLIQSDLTWTVAQLLGVGLLLAIVLGGSLFLFLRPMPILAVMGVLVGFAVPIAYAANSRLQRSKKLSMQIPDALDMMSRSLRAGHGISAGFKLVATEMPAPIAVEFGRCFEENNMGVEFREAVTNMTQRAQNNLDLKLFAVSLVIQHETGGNLAEILEKIASTIRERYKFFGKLRSLTAEVKVSAGLISMTPFVFAAIITFFNPRYLLPLIYTPTGRLFLLTGIILWITGWIFIRALSRVDY